jgi:hypothetical protein
MAEFFGERLVVDRASLTKSRAPAEAVEEGADGPDRLLFRRAYEAINVGVVPPDPAQLVALSIGGDVREKQVRRWLEEAPTQGLCKVIFGDYGTGKSHYLKLVESAALRNGWVVSFVEFDPKQADPAKPHLVYRAILNGLRFPRREDGSQSKCFFDLFGEVRRRWMDIRDGHYFRESEWFEPALTILRNQPHSDDPLYRNGVDWLAGHPVPQAVMVQLSKAVGGKVLRTPRMPKTLETADIYVYHLVVINEWCRRLGYKGLLIVLDEAEHVRGFNVNRRGRATNLFDLLARAANPPLADVDPPFPNEHGFGVPKFWEEGPHFGVVVALTEGSTFSDSTRPLRDSCMFLHRPDDMVRLQSPNAAEYRDWCNQFLERFATHYSEAGTLLTDEATRTAVASVLAEEYSRQSDGERTIRLWTKVASFVPSLLFARVCESPDELTTVVRKVAREASGEVLPWEPS